MGFHNVVLHDGYLHHERKAGRRWEAGDDYLAWLRERAGASADYAAHGAECNSWVARPWHMDESLHPTNWVVMESIRFLERRDPAKPFFLWMSFVRPHAPLDPPQAYWDMYADRDIPAPPVGEWAQAAPQAAGARRAPIPFNAAAGALDERTLKRARAAYYALITHIDHQIGRFLDALGEHGAAEDTLIVFTSDHGELLGDHNLFRKSLPYEGSARIPMIVTAATGNRFGIKAGATRDEVVELRDVLPTFLEAAGVEVPETVDGMSMLRLARGEKAEWRGHLHGEHVRGDESMHYVTDARMKYAWFSGDGREQLFDIEADPQELHDLAKDEAGSRELERMRAVMVKKLAGREEGFTDGKRLITGRPVRPMLRRRD
jgi:arylsulfatase A-like enzyme